jgi:hypothetical protein
MPTRICPQSSYDQSVRFRGNVRASSTDTTNRRTDSSKPTQTLPEIVTATITAKTTIATIETLQRRRLWIVHDCLLAAHFERGQTRFEHGRTSSGWRTSMAGTTVCICVLLRAISELVEGLALRNGCSNTDGVAGDMGRKQNERDCAADCGIFRETIAYKCRGIL